MATVKLQGIYEKKNAIPEAELKPGMVAVWNFGYTETIKSVEPTKSGKSVKCVIISDESGKEYTRTMRNDRLVAIEQKEEPEVINPIDKAISCRKETYNGIYSDIGTALEGFETLELTKYYLNRFGDGGLRYFLEQQIIASEINKNKEHNK